MPCFFLKFFVAPDYSIKPHPWWHRHLACAGWKAKPPPKKRKQVLPAQAHSQAGAWEREKGKEENTAYFLRLFSLRPAAKSGL